MPGEYAKRSMNSMRSRATLMPRVIGLAASSSIAALRVWRPSWRKMLIELVVALERARGVEGTAVSMAGIGSALLFAARAPRSSPTSEGGGCASTKGSDSLELAACEVTRLADATGASRFEASSGISADDGSSNPRPFFSGEAV